MTNFEPQFLNLITMKKLFKTTLLLFIGLTISSCSSNEDNLKTASEIRMTINGNEVVFDDVIVNKLSGEEGTSISVSGSVGVKTDKILNFYFYIDQLEILWISVNPEIWLFSSREIAIKIDLS